MSQESRKTAKDPIPDFATRQEEADFWDTHDFADYWDDWEPVDVKFSDDLTSWFAVPIDADSLTKVLALDIQHNSPWTN